MSLTIEDFTVVSQLQPSEPVLSTDYFMVSQNDQNGYISRKLQYSSLCATLLNDISGFINQLIGNKYDGLYLSVQTNSMNIQALNNTLSSAVCAIVKMANCIQANKQHIVELSSQISDVVEMLPQITCITSSIDELSTDVTSMKGDLIGISNDLISLSNEVEEFSNKHNVTVDNNGSIFNELSVVRTSTTDYYDLVRSGTTQKNVLYVLDPTMVLPENDAYVDEPHAGLFAKELTQEMQDFIANEETTPLKASSKENTSRKRKKRKTANNAIG